MPLLPLPKPPWISRWRWPPPAMEASPTASRVPHPRDRRDCSRLAEVESVVLCGGDGAPHLRAHKPERSSTEAMASPGIDLKKGHQPIGTSPCLFLFHRPHTIQWNLSFCS
uniref:Uncharacterized protein n=1 Tax=Aegilops tauschii subsp. strangulata TaxID=200361 RepID=A0A453FJJ8_AEGTS